VLLYAIAWLLLPDVDGEIHLERMLRGIIDPAIVGIAVMGVIALVPIVQGGWLGWRWWPDLASLTDPIFGIDFTLPLRVLWVLAIVGGITALIIWLVNRASKTSPGGGDAARMASAQAAAGPGTAQPMTDAAAAPGATTPLGFTGSTAPTAASGHDDPSLEPPVPAEGADADALAEWRVKHEAWRRSRDEWNRSQQNAERAARARAAAENKARAMELVAQADAARRIRRAERPRASAAYVGTVLGLALASGASASIWALGTNDLGDMSTAVGLAVMTLVLAAGMFTAAVRRRRSGFLAFVTTVTTLGMLVAAITPGRTIVAPNVGISMLESQVVVQPVGDAYLVSDETLRQVTGTPEIELTQGIGNVLLTIMDDTQIVLDARDAGRIEVLRRSDAQTVTRVPIGDDDDMLTLGRDGGAPPDARLVVHQAPGGTILVQIHERTGR
jgi:hypothetical protein